MMNLSKRTELGIFLVDGKSAVPVLKSLQRRVGYCLWVFFNFPEERGEGPSVFEGCSICIEEENFIEDDCY